MIMNTSHDGQWYGFPKLTASDMDYAKRNCDVTISWFYFAFFDPFFCVYGIQSEFLNIMGNLNCSPTQIHQGIWRDTSCDATFGTDKKGMSLVL